MSIETYAAFSTNTEQRIASSSGGVFSLIAQTVLQYNGAVYGVAMTEDCRSAEFIRVEDEESLSKLRGSKYFQARVGKIYHYVKTDLENGKSVLFSGTICQINGLKNFLNKDYSTLYCVDVICHGVPSQMLWQKYVDYIEMRYNSKLESVNFRCKDQGWTLFGMKEKLGRQVVFSSLVMDPFMIMFLRNYGLRPSCYQCVAKNDKRSDLTIADFWGINRVAPEMNDEKGTSLVIVRSEKGKKLYKDIQAQVVDKVVGYEDGVRSNPAESHSAQRPVERNLFYNDLEKLSFQQMIKKYCKPEKLPIKVRLKKLSRTIVRFMNGGE